MTETRYGRPYPWGWQARLQALVDPIAHALPVSFGSADDHTTWAPDWRDESEEQQAQVLAIFASFDPWAEEGVDESTGGLAGPDSMVYSAELSSDGASNDLELPSEPVQELAVDQLPDDAAPSEPVGTGSEDVVEEEPLYATIDDLGNYYADPEHAETIYSGMGSDPLGAAKAMKAYAVLGKKQEYRRSFNDLHLRRYADLTNRMIGHKENNWPPLSDDENAELAKLKTASEGIDANADRLSDLVYNVTDFVSLDAVDIRQGWPS